MVEKARLAAVVDCLDLEVKIVAADAEVCQR